MSEVLSDRKATAPEVRAHAEPIGRRAAALGLGEPRLRWDGTVIVRSDEPGYRWVNRLATQASALVGAYVHVITDDVPGAVDTTPL